MNWKELGKKTKQEIEDQYAYQLDPSLQSAMPSIKIIKNSRGYNYEFKVLSLDIAEVEKLNNELRKMVERAEKEDKKNE